MLPGMTSIAGMQGGVSSSSSSSTGSLTVSVSNPSVSKSQGSFGPGNLTLTTPSTTASASGGVAPYSYAWARISGSTAVSATAPGAATTAFTGSVPLGEQYGALFECTATDANGATGKASVQTSLHHVDLR